MKTWFIIVNWNGLKRLSIALSALNKVKGNFEVLIADNGSTDGSLEMVGSYLNKPIHILMNHNNLGFAEGNNRAIQFASNHGAEFVALINDDLAVQPDWLEHMLETMSTHPKAAILGGTILFLDRPQIINSTGISVDFFYRSPDENFNQPLDSSHVIEEPLTAVSAGAMFLRMSHLKQIGLFNPTFFAYFEDVDLCLRARKLGFEVRRVPKAISYHQYNGTFAKFQEKRRFLLARNHLFIVRQHANFVYRCTFIPAFVIYRFLKVFYFFLTGKEKVALAELRGTYAGITSTLHGAKQL